MNKELVRYQQMVIQSMQFSALPKQKKSIAILWYKGFLEGLSHYLLEYTNDNDFIWKYVHYMQAPVI